MSDTRGKPISEVAYGIKDQISQIIINGAIHLVEGVNRFTYISEMMRKTIYKDCVFIYLRYHSQYRHMWE